MEEIYQLVEKFKTACEDIAEIKRLLTWQVENKVTQPLREAAQTTGLPLTNSMQEIAESIEPNPFDRKAIKARLDELQILYQSRAKTSTLAKLLESVEVHAVEVEIPVSDEPINVRIDDLTLEELRAKLGSLNVVYQGHWDKETLAKLFKEKLANNAQTFEAPAQTFEATTEVPPEIAKIKEDAKVHAPFPKEPQAQKEPDLNAGVSVPEAKPVEEPQAQKEPDLNAGGKGEPLLDLIDKTKEPQKTLEVPTLDDFTHMLKEWAVKNGTDKVRKMLADNNVKRISELSDQQRAIIWKQFNA